MQYRSRAYTEIKHAPIQGESLTHCNHYLLTVTHIKGEKQSPPYRGSNHVSIEEELVNLCYEKRVINGALIQRETVNPCNNLLVSKQRLLGRKTTTHYYKENL